MIEELTQFVESLRQMDVLPDEEAAAAATVLTEASDDESRCRQLSRCLQQSNRLTEFQWEQLQACELRRLLVGEYVLTNKLDSGGMGQVFLAHHVLMGRDVAIKFTLNADDSLRDRFFREVEAASKLSHPNIVASLDAGMVDDDCYLVMEYVDGDNLSRLVRRGGPLSYSDALDCICQAAEGLAYAHQQRVIHRDIKPGNLLLDNSGRVKILDMGLARLHVSQPATVGGDSATMDPLESEKTLTTRGEMLGTIDYMAPEQAANPSAAIESADIYSLGCTLHYLLTGGPPYYEPNMQLLQRIIAHREQPIPKLSDRQQGIPPAADAVFAKMLAKNHRDRYLTVPELLVDLRALQRNHTPVVQAKQTARPSIGRIAGALLVLALVVIAVVLWNEWPSGRNMLIPEKPHQSGVDGGKADQGQAGSRPQVPSDLMSTEPLKVTGPVDLLPLIRLERDRMAGSGWRMDGGQLWVPASQPSKLAVRVIPPPAFTLELTVERQSLGGPFLIGVSDSARKFLCRMGVVRANGSTMTSLGTLDGKMVVNRIDAIPLGMDEPVRLRLRVLPRQLALDCDGREVLHWSGDFQQLDLGAGWSMGDEVGIMFASNDASFLVSDVVLTPSPDATPP